MPAILIVDDERDLLSLLDFNLRQAGFETLLAASGQEALQQLRRRVPDLVLLDVMLPDVSGTEICRGLKSDPRTKHVPVMMLTAKGEEVDKVVGFELGADDYVTKPFSVRELVLRVRAVLRRGSGAGASTGAAIEPVGPLRVDVEAHRAYVQDEEVVLTPLEFRLLVTFMSRVGRVLPLAEKVNAHVTGFLSGIYLLPDQLRGTYIGPGHGAGRASISFGGTDAEVTTRIADLNAAVAAGHEIGTHFNGHFCTGNEPSGAVWTARDWTSELDQFFDIVRDATARGLRVPETSIKGGRTPCLEGRPEAFLPAMSARAMTYDTSLTTEGIAWPEMRDGMWEFWVPVVRVPALSGKKVIMQDYNLWYALNGAKEEPDRDAELTAATLDTYRAAYQAAYNTNRAPLTVGNHFNDWSGGAFSQATEQFMNEVCVRANTVCATYTEVLTWMKLQDPAVLDPFLRKPHAQVS